MKMAETAAVAPPSSRLLLLDCVDAAKEAMKVIFFRYLRVDDDVLACLLPVTLTGTLCQKCPRIVSLETLCTDLPSIVRITLRFC